VLRAHVDHHHETGTLRGLLCPECNVKRVSFLDAPQWLQDAARDYHRSRTPSMVEESKCA
jgi:hypothetical protein